VVGWLVCVLQWPVVGSRIQLLTVLQGASRPHIDRRGICETGSSASSYQCTLLIPRDLLSVLWLDTGSASALIAAAS
jgi:hypothetical protein